MNFNKLIGSVVILMLASATVFAADAKHDNHAAAPATDSQATAAKEVPSKDAQSKETPVKDAASQTTDEPAKPVVAKKSRKPARAKPQHKAPTHGTQADASVSKEMPATAPPAASNTSSVTTNLNASESAGSKRVRVKDRSTAAAATAQPADAHTTSSAPAVNAVNDGHNAPAASDDHAANAAPAGKNKQDDAASPASKQAPSAKDSAGTKDSHTSTTATPHDAPAAPVANVAPAAPDMHADSHAAPAKASVAEPSADYCNPPLKSEVAALFDRWNASLRTGDPKKVAANYAPGSVLLPTVSNRARFTAAEKEDYFAHFLTRRPEGSIDDRVIDVDCNSATDAGLYTFRFSDGTMVKARYSFSYRKIGSQWLITSHHSSGMPEKTEVAAESPVAKTPNAKAAERSEQGSPARGWVRYP